VCWCRRTEDCLRDVQPRHAVPSAWRLHTLGVIGRTSRGSGGARASGGVRLAQCDSHLRGATRLVRVAPPACDSHSASRTPEARVALFEAATRTPVAASRTAKTASRRKKSATRTPKRCESHFSSLRVAQSELRLAPRVALQHVESRRDAVRVGASPLRVAPLGLRAVAAVTDQCAAAAPHWAVGRHQVERMQADLRGRYRRLQSPGDWRGSSSVLAAESAA